MGNYFYKKEYTYLYLTRFCYSLAHSVVEIFGTVMLYKNGMPIYLILLVYGLRFGLMGLLSPLFMKISAKFGIASCVLAANIFRLAASYMLLFGNVDNVVLFIMFMGLPGALVNPLDDATSSKYVAIANRGKYNSVKNISQIAGQAVASALVAWSVVTDNHPLLFAVIAAFFLLDYLFTLKINYKPDFKNQKVFKNAMRHTFKGKNDFKTIYCLRTFHIIEKLFLPLYLYLALQDFILFATVIIISLLIQVITVLITGRLVDKNIVKTNDVMSLFKALTSAIFLVAQSKVMISINRTANDSLEKLYETSMQTSIQNMIKKSKIDHTLMSTVGQMCLCFTEVIVFPLLAILAHFVQDKVFIAIFIMSIVATFVINAKANKNNGLRRKIV